MPKFKEKPRTRERGARKPAMLSPRQAAKLLKDRYVRQLDQKRADRENETQYAVDQVEGAGQAAAEEVTDHFRPRSPRQRERPIKERPRQATAGPECAPHAPEGVSPAHESRTNSTAVPRDRRVEFKTRQTTEARYSAPASPKHSVSLDHPSIESIYPTGQRGPGHASGRAGRLAAPTAAGTRRQPRTGTTPARPAGRRAGRVLGRAPSRSAAGGRYALKERPAARTPALKRRDGFYTKAGFRPKSGPGP